MKLTEEQVTRILVGLREVEKQLKAIPYQSAVKSRKGTAEYCIEQVQAIRKELAGECA